jgi:hypothetical protein
VAKIVSDWRREAEAVVRATLAALPEGASLKEKRKALRQADVAEGGAGGVGHHEPGGGREGGG